MIPSLTQSKFFLKSVSPYTSPVLSNFQIMTNLSFFVKNFFTTFLFSQILLSHRVYPYTSPFSLYTFNFSNNERFSILCQESLTTFLFSHILLSHIPLHEKKKSSVGLHLHASFFFCREFSAFSSAFVFLDPQLSLVLGTSLQ